MAKIIGNDSSETLVGAVYADTIYGGGGEDLVIGGDGNDVLEGGVGNDTLMGGLGDDTLRMFAWSGEPIADRNGTRVSDDGPYPDDDIAYGGAGEDVFQITWLINADDETVEQYRDVETGYVNYTQTGIARANAYVHNHWVQTIGVKTIADFEVGVDSLDLRGHTIRVKQVLHENGDTVVDFASVQNSKGVFGSHHGDNVGRLIIKDVYLDAAEFEVQYRVYFGAETVTKTGTTGTGLDQLVNSLVMDSGLSASNPTHLLLQGIDAADALNHIIVNSIRATGIANDGDITVDDVLDLNAYILTNHAEEWDELYGYDQPEENSEQDEYGNEIGPPDTGYHLILGEGGNGTKLFGANPAETIGPWLYNIGRPLDGSVFVVEPGEQESSVYGAARLLNKFLAEDLQKGTLSSEPVQLSAGGSTGTGLDKFVEIILNDDGLEAKALPGDIKQGAKAADALNNIIVDAVMATGAASDNDISPDDVRAMNAYILSNHAMEWKALYGYNECGVETGYNRVLGDGGDSRLFGANALETVGPHLYNIGRELVGNVFEVEPGEQISSVFSVARILDRFFDEDFAEGTFDDLVLG